MDHAHQHPSGLKRSANRQPLIRKYHKSRRPRSRCHQEIFEEGPGSCARTPSGVGAGMEGVHRFHQANHEVERCGDSVATGERTFGEVGGLTGSTNYRDACRHGTRVVNLQQQMEQTLKGVSKEKGILKNCPGWPGVDGVWILGRQSGSPSRPSIEAIPPQCQITSTSGSPTIADSDSVF